MRHFWVKFGHSETFEYLLAPMEAMSTGLPVVGTRLKSLENIVNDTGLLFKLGDANELASSLKKIMKSDFRLLGKKAAARISKNFDWNQITTTYLEFYSHVLGLS